MFRITLMAKAVALTSAAAVAQAPTDVDGASGRGSTGPTFPAPGPETQIATAPMTGGDADGQPAPGPPGINSDNSGPVTAASASPHPTR